MIRSVCVILLLTGGMIGVVKAEMNPSAEDRARLINSWMKQNLTLTINQVRKVKALNLKYEQMINELMMERKGFACMQAVRKALAEKEEVLQVLLTALQFEEYQKGKCELKELLRRKEI